MLIFYLSLFESEEERQSFSSFYERVSFKCLRTAISITKDHALAEDAVHNAFMKVISIKEKFFSMPCNKQETLIVIIVKHKAIDIMRAYRKLEIDNVGEKGDESDSGEFDLERNYESVESYEQLKNLVKKLPEIYRVVFEMKYFQELDNAEIAELLDVTKIVIATRLNRAKKKLADMLTESGEIYDR